MFKMAEFFAATPSMIAARGCFGSAYQVPNQRYPVPASLKIAPESLLAFSE